MLKPDEVRHVARLARLYLSDQDIDVMTTQLGAILEYVEQLEQVDTSGVPAAAHALPLRDRMRPDAVTPGLSGDQALANAPQREEGYVRVPRIL